MDSTQTFTLHVSEETHHDITVEVPDELLDNMRQNGIDTSDTSAVAKWLTDNLDPDDGLITDVISDATISAVNGREVTDVAPGPHERSWVLKQNVTTKGTVMEIEKTHATGAAGDDDAALRRSSGAMTVGKRNRLAGHTLPHEGRIYANGVWQRVAQARCSCGATSPILGSNNARKAWHRQHKDEIRRGGESRRVIP